MHRAQVERGVRVPEFLGRGLTEPVRGECGFDQADIGCRQRIDLIVRRDRIDERPLHPILREPLRIFVDVRYVDVYVYALLLALQDDFAITRRPLLQPPEPV